MKKFILSLALIFTFPVQPFAETLTVNMEPEAVTIPVLQSRLRYGDIIKESDLRYINVAPEKIRDNVVTEAEEIIGMTPKRSIQANRPIRKMDLTTKVLIEKGTSVDVIYETKSMQLRAIGIAMDKGSEGDSIRVKNSQSGKVIQGVITGPGVVKVSYSREYMASLD